MPAPSRFGEAGFARDEHHLPSLERAVLRALARSDGARALQLADRLCRVASRAEVTHLLLRADALERNGDRAGALVDIESALGLVPEDRAANRRLLAWGDDDRAQAAAEVLLRIDSDPATLAGAIDRLRPSGADAFGTVTIFEDVLRGWAAWDKTPRVELLIERRQGNITLPLSADPRHPLRALPYAAGFSVRLPGGSKIDAVSLRQDGRPFFSLRIETGTAQPEPSESSASAGHAEEIDVTVVVPVYEDPVATAACLDSVLPELQKTRSRLIIIDDAAPDPSMQSVLARFESHPRVQLLRNPANIGFVASVNRGLALASAGDVLLLNADAVLPPGALARLSVVAHSAPDIGTVTPLANNGEFTSLPLPFTENPLPEPDRLKQLDRAAQAANGGAVVDMPNGIGFCLYVTRAFLDAVGPLSADYHRGYLEDVDWCLRGRRAGFRSVCATGIHVGHAGSLSFGQEKRALVMRNLKVLERRFPLYRAECAAFVAADPLHKARQALEGRLAPSQRGAVLIITGGGTSATIADARASRIRAEGQAALVARFGRNDAGLSIRFIDPAGGIPQSLAFEVGTARGRRAFSSYMTGLAPQRIEIVDPRAIGPELVTEMFGTGVALDFLVVNAGLLCPRGATLMFSQERSTSPEEFTLNEGWRVRTGTIARKRARTWRDTWLSHVMRGGRLLVPDDDAAAFAARFFPGARIERIPPPEPSEEPAATHEGTLASPPPRLGLLPIETSPDSYRELAAICAHVTRERPSLDIVVLGRTLDDLGLMKSEQVFVTGDVPAGELPAAVVRHRVSHLMIGPRQPLFGHPLQLAARTLPRPVAWFDWARNGGTAHSEGLRLKVELDADAVAKELVRWIG